MPRFLLSISIVFVVLFSGCSKSTEDAPPPMKEQSALNGLWMSTDTDTLLTVMADGSFNVTLSDGAYHEGRWDLMDGDVVILTFASDSVQCENLEVNFGFSIKDEVLSFSNVQDDCSNRSYLKESWQPL